MSPRMTTIDNLTRCYADVEELIDSLAPADWDVQSLCPEWTVRGVITHLASVESLLAGWMPTEENNTPPFEKVAEFTTTADGWSNDQLASEAKQVFARRREELSNTSDEDFTQASMTPVGPGTYQSFMDVRVFDFWVHLRDMTGPLGRSTDDGGPAAEMALDQVHNSMGYVVGKKIGLPDGMSMTVRLTDPIQRDIHAAVEGRAGVVDTLDDPSLVLTTDSVTFVQMACGRIDPQSVIDAGKISWSGDAEWGEKAARNLAYTM